MNFYSSCFAIAVWISSVFLVPAAAQDTTSVHVTSAVVTSNYPSRPPGVLIKGSDWLPLSSESPRKLHLKHGLAPALTYGIAPAAAVAEYEGLHGPMNVEEGRPVICICHMLSIPGSPTLVRLHPKKDYRELDAGKLHIVGKVAQADAADLISVDVSHPEDTVWLIQAREPLMAGEYALMLGTQNMSIFSFTVVMP